MKRHSVAAAATGAVTHMSQYPSEHIVQGGPCGMHAKAITLAAEYM